MGRRSNSRARHSGACVRDRPIDTRATYGLGSAQSERRHGEGEVAMGSGNRHRRTLGRVVFGAGLAVVLMLGPGAGTAQADPPQGWTGVMIHTGFTFGTAGAEVTWYFDGIVDEVVTQSPSGSEWRQTGRHTGATGFSGPYSQGSCIFHRATGSAPAGQMEVTFSTFPLPSVGGPNFGIIARSTPPFQTFLQEGTYTCPGSSGGWSETQTVAPPHLETGVVPLSNRTYANGTDPIEGIGGRPLFNSVIQSGSTYWKLTREPDRDFDGEPDVSDNCVEDFNPLQEDTDGDGIGDICEVERITVAKQTIPTGADAEFEFTGALSGTIGDGETLSTEVEPGTYSVTELEEEGWALSSIVCSDDDSTGTGSTATFVVDEGEQVTCLFSNVATIDARDDVITDWVDPGERLTYDVLANDSPSGDLVIESVGLPAAGGSYVVVGGSIQYTPPTPTFMGDIEISYTVRDSSGLTDSALLSFTYGLCRGVNVYIAAGDEPRTPKPWGLEQTMEACVDGTDADLLGGGGTGTGDPRGHSSFFAELIPFSAFQWVLPLQNQPISSTVWAVGGQAQMCFDITNAPLVKPTLKEIVKQTAQLFGWPLFIDELEFLVPKGCVDTWQVGVGWTLEADGDFTVTISSRKNQDKGTGWTTFSITDYEPSTTFKMKPEVRQSYSCNLLIEDSCSRLPGGVGNEK